MLRQVYIVKNHEKIYSRTFGKALDDEGYGQAYKQISKEAFKIATESIQYHDFFKYRISYLAVPDFQIIFMFVSDLSDKFENVEKELAKCKKEFMDMFGAILDEKLDEDTFEIFDPTIESIHKNLRPKLSLVGFSGVGKTTITRLITAEDIPVEHIPTITGDIGTIKIGKLHFHLWDFAGQEQFSFLWNNFVKGSDAVLLITDSTLENCEKSKYFVELIKKESPYAHTAVIGNKQDLPDAMPIADIERHLGMKAYSMIATDPDNRDKMITIIADILEMSGEVSPLLKPLIERDKKVGLAEKAIENGDFEKAVTIFEELADLSLELGDDRVSQDFHDKAQKIKSILKKAKAQAPATPAAAPVSAPSTPPPAPVAPPIAAPPAPPVTAPPVAPPPAPAAAPPPAPPAPTGTMAPPPTPVTPPPAPTVAPPAPPPTPIPPTPTPSPTGNQGGQLDQLGMLLKKLQSGNIAPKPSVPVPPAPTFAGNSSGFAQPMSPSLGQKPTVAPPAPPTTRPPITPPVATPTPAPAASPAAVGAVGASQLITDLKIKIANVNKTLLDLEMQNITGEISDEDFAQKSSRLQAVKQKYEEQLTQLQ